MTIHYHLQPLSEPETANWDQLIAPYESRELFHRKVWLDYLAASRGAEIRMWSIQDGCETLGYLCGGIVRKGPFRIFGSPLKGWGTNFMGPVGNGTLDQPAFLQALDELAQREGFAISEMESRGWGREPFQGAGYHTQDLWTYQVKLGDEDEMLRRMDKGRRYGIRKAERAGLWVEEAADPAVADEYYDLFTALMGRKGMVPPYPREVPRVLFAHLRRAGLILALRVRDSAGKLLAIGLFPYDDRSIYYWGGAGDKKAEKECPNDLMHWTVMRWAAERGIRRYDLCGWGRFKREFGGELLTLNRWHKCYWRTARWARRGYEFCFQRRIRLRGWFQQIASQPESKGGSS